MATITTPAAGVSPYQAVAAAPAVLRASADGTTVLATAAAAAATVSELAATNANTLVVVSGQAALNSLITTSQPGVFDGANVTINLEEQNFTTTNQVTATTNYPAGNTGEIQYNSGSNSFASSAFFTFTSGNVVTPGIRTDGYFYANGSPFSGGGNAAIGNFVFSGDTVTIGDSNQDMNITGNGTGNVNISSGIHAWIFESTGNLTFPTGMHIDDEGANTRISQNTGALKITAGNTASFTAGWIEIEGNTVAGNVAYLTANGNAHPDSLIIRTGDQAAATYTWEFDNVGDLSAPGNISAINLVINSIRSDDSSFVTVDDGVNVNGEISATGNITGNYFIGNGSQLTGIIANTGNVTFSSEIVIGTGTSNLISGLYLAPSSSSANANMYLRVRGNIVDEPTHIHFDTGNNAYYNQFIGDDNKYIQLANTGNIVINSNDVAGNSAQWNFDYDGVLTLPNADASGFGNIYFEQNSSTITFGLDDNATPFLYSFATSGITLPKGGATIRDTVGNAVAFGRDAAGTGPQGNAAVAIGQQAGETSQGASSVAIGFEAGLNTQGANAVAIGTSAGQSTQQVGAVAVGLNAGTYTQGQNAVAIGSRAGNTSQQTQSVAIGVDAAADSQGQNSVAIGSSAAAGSQGEKAVAIGLYAGNTTQGNSSVAIGDNAGYDTQGANSVAIGSYAGQSAQGNNSIIINATGAALNALTANTFTVAPVRNDVANIANIMFYNVTTKEITYGNTISVTGNITGNYFIGNGSQLTSVAVPSQTILPTIQTITAVARSAGLFGGGQGGANVTVANTIPVTEYGVIITAGTVSETYKTGALGSLPGPVSLTFSTGLNSTQYTLFAYVTSNAGTYYSDAVTGTSGICLLVGTQIALSDGTHKAIEDITYTDKLLSWDFDRGCYAETTAMWIKRSETGSQYNLLTFSDGTTLRTFDQHRIFNKQAGAFTYPMTAATPVGTVTVNEHGQEIILTNKQVIRDTIEYYNVITDYHMNLFSDSVLTSCRFNNIYPIVDMKFVKDNRTLRTRAEFENVPDRFFHGLRLAEQTADIETVEWYVNRLLRTEVSTHAELAV